MSEPSAYPPRIRIEVPGIIFGITTFYELIKPSMIRFGKT
jgi:hypothetical protein